MESGRAQWPDYQERKGKTVILAFLLLFFLKLISRKNRSFKFRLGLPNTNCSGNLKTLIKSIIELTYQERSVGIIFYISSAKSLTRNQWLSLVPFVQTDMGEYQASG